MPFAWSRNQRWRNAIDWVSNKPSLEHVNYHQGSTNSRGTSSSPTLASVKQKISYLHNWGTFPKIFPNARQASPPMSQLLLISATSFGRYRPKAEKMMELISAANCVDAFFFGTENIGRKNQSLYTKLKSPRNNVKSGGKLCQNKLLEVSTDYELTSFYHACDITSYRWNWWWILLHI